MIKIAVCDDMEVVSKNFKKVLISYDFSTEIDGDIFISGNDLCNNAITKKYDSILLDIELTEDNKEIGSTIRILHEIMNKILRKSKNITITITKLKIIV